MSDPVYPPLNTVWTGLRARCPRCGKGALLRGYLTIRDRCPACSLDFSFADPADGPAFFVMSGVGVVGMMAFMAFEFTVHPPIWVHAVVTAPILVVLCLGTLRPFKGWLVAEQYIHKAEQARFESVGKHGTVERWRRRSKRSDIAD